MATTTGAARFVPHAMLTAMIAIWGASYAVVKVALDELPPFAIVALRFWLAVLCLLPFAGRTMAVELGRTWQAGLVTGAALAAGYLLQTMGMTETSASMGGFLAGLIVLLVAVGGWLFLGARFGPRTGAALLIGTVGAVMLCWPAAGATGENGVAATDTPRGIALQIGSSTAYAAHVLLLSHFGRRIPILAFCLWQLGLVAAAASLAAWAHGDGTAILDADWDPRLLATIAYLGVLATALGIGVQSRIQHRIPPAHVALLFTLQPIFAAVAGHLALGDDMGPLQLAGGVTVVIAVVLSSVDRRVS
ncbi:MAG: DMT family transporter [Planctomycetes bacterium]|nr:DMT family transporter [Planctomycetota bacterium]